MLEVNEHLVLPGDLYMMCSDGLSDMVDDPTIAKIVTTQGELEVTAEELIAAANANGGRDNISVLLAVAAESAEKRGLIARLLGK
jgi:protein phosphatase